MATVTAISAEGRVIRMSEYAELPWSVEDTIENLKELKEGLQERCIIQNLHGRGEKDAYEVAFDFDRAIKALEEVQKYRAIGTVEECRASVEKQKEIRNKAIDDFEEKLLENAPKNYAGTLELGGMSCYLSANKVKQIAEKLKGGAVNE